MHTKQLGEPIENIILESIFKIGFVIVLVHTMFTLYFTRFTFNNFLFVDLAFFFATGSSYLLYKTGRFRLAVVWLGLIFIVTVFHQILTADRLTTTSMATIIAIGLVFSILLKRRLPLILHGVTLLAIAIAFIWMSLHPERYGMPDGTYIIHTGVTNFFIYFFTAYVSWVMKQRYNKSIDLLAISNHELSEKSQEVETQNEELVQAQENLSQLNNHLEELVELRTQEVKKQNELIIQYAYANAHKVRGPIARILGLIQLSKIDTSLTLPFLFQKIEEQAHEIDHVVKGINETLAS